MSVAPKAGDLWVWRSNTPARALLITSVRKTASGHTMVEYTAWDGTGYGSDRAEDFPRSHEFLATTDGTREAVEAFLSSVPWCQPRPRDWERVWGRCSWV